MNGRRVLTHAAMELRLLLRNGEQLLLAFAIPLGLLIAGLQWGAGIGLDRATFPASILAVATWSSAFTSVAVATGFERRYGVLERLVATPLTRVDLIVGKTLAAAGLIVLQLLVLIAVAAAFGWRPVVTVAGVGSGVVATGLGVAAFTAFGLLLAGTLKAEVTLALANLIYLIGLAVGGLIVDQPPWLPTAALGTAFRAAALGSPAPLALAALAAWALILIVLTRKVFRWTS